MGILLVAMATIEVDSVSPKVYGHRFSNLVQYCNKPGVCIWRYGANNSATEKSAAPSHSNSAPNVLVLPRVYAHAIKLTSLRQTARAKAQFSRRDGGAKGPAGA